MDRIENRCVKSIYRRCNRYNNYNNLEQPVREKSHLSPNSIQTNSSIACNWQTHVIDEKIYRLREKER